ncbi:RAVE protein 1 C terminal-domain-containing protein [Cyathus striatus]|nr:RAVE protein 1 C terminal-domain-containing protein [Cyathus striatus]
MLQLLHSYIAYPLTALHPLLLANQSLIAYPSADTVVILNARSLALVRVLAFWEAFPGMIHTKAPITSMVVDSAMKLIVAATSTRIAAWILSGVQHDTWRVHSTLVLPDTYAVTALDTRAGLLAVGSQEGLSVYTLVLENDLPTWSKKWSSRTVSPSLISFAPSLMSMATVTAGRNEVRIWSTPSGKYTQVIPHPRPVVNLTWRHTQASSRDDLILYTVTSDSTLRIFLPVLDSPDHLQLHASLDLFSSLPYSVTSSYLTPSSSIFWLDREIVGNVLDNVLKQHIDQNDAKGRRIAEIKQEGWDLFLRIIDDGSVVVTAIANLDRRPPTLLTQFTLQHSPPSTFPSMPTHLYTTPGSHSTLLTIISTSPLASFDLSPLSFFDVHADGLKEIAKGASHVIAEDSEISRFVRTPEGKGVAVLKTDGAGDVWTIAESGTQLVHSGSWKSADFVVVLDEGRQFATYSKSNDSLTLHTSPPQTVTLPRLENLFTIPSSDGREYIFGITPDFLIIELAIEPSLCVISQNHLPLSTHTKFIQPVDPMAWKGKKQWTEHDVLLSVSENGELAFWVPEAHEGWRCTGQVRTGRTGFKKARCSSAKKTALIVANVEGDELSVWDSTESEFSSGFEYRNVYKEPVLDLDWGSTPDMQSILAVGFSRHVNILCQQRMTYFDQGPGWDLCRKIDLEHLSPYPISDSIWLTQASFLVGAGRQMTLFGERPLELGEMSEDSLFEYVARKNGPLEDYHPQMLLQCLLWDKIELVKDIIVNLALSLDGVYEKPHENTWIPLPIDKFLGSDYTKELISPHKKQYNVLFDEPMPNRKSEEQEFSRPLVIRLLEALERHPLPHLTSNEQSHLLVLIQTTLEIDEQRRALDSNGLRYLISMRLFYILNQKAISKVSGPPIHGAVPRQGGRRERLRYRDMIWAFHSDSQDLLLNASTIACGDKMLWSDARALGVPIWLNTPESLRAQLEVIARNEYMSGESRDPTASSLYYFALGKVKLVHGLWRQAAWHKEQAMMLKFLANDFTQPRWRTAALKNAYALLSKQRFEYSAAFFLLGNSLKDAVNVCIRQIGDFQLAIALARVVEHSNEGPILQEILTYTVLPIAFELGNRWLGSWAFWLLHRRDLAVRILLTPLPDIAAAFNIKVTEIGEPHYDDPSLALLFSQLRSKTLQAVKGTSEISGRAEFNFVLQMARVFCRMGCQVLALDLVRSWSFERPSTSTRGNVKGQSTTRRPIFPLEPALRRRSSIVIDMDLTSLPPTRSASPERRDPQPERALASIKEENDLLARKAGLGHLIKSAKQDVQVPEFDMNAFF